MRFKPTQNNLVVQLGPDEIARFVDKVVAFLVPRFTRKVYLHAEQAELLPKPQPGVVVVLKGHEPSNLLSCFRIIISPGEAVLVSSRECRFDKDQWREVAEHVTK